MSATVIERLRAAERDPATAADLRALCKDAADDLEYLRSIAGAVSCPSDLKDTPA